MDKNFQRIRKKAERVFVAYEKGDRSRHLHSQLVKLQQELEALMPNELPPFLRKTKLQ